MSNEVRLSDFDPPTNEEPAEEKPKGITSGTLAGLLRARYPLPEWALIFELRNGTGAHGMDRQADAAAWCCWPSKGLHRLAFEIKVSRSDWARELKAPAKRAWLEEEFHETWFVVAPGVVKEEEIPVGWGLMVATKAGDGLRVTRHAVHRNYPPTNGGELSALRALAEQLHMARHANYCLDGEVVTQEQIKAIVEDRCKHAREQLTRSIENASKAEREHQAAESALLRPVQDLLHHCGVRTYGYTLDNYSEFIGKPMLETIEKAVTKRLERHLKLLEDAAETLAALRNALRSDEKTPEPTE